MRRLIAVGLIFAMAAIFAAIRIWDSSSDNARRRAQAEAAPLMSESVGLSAEIRTDTITEFVVEMGKVPYATIATEHLRIKNTTDEPLSLTDYKATCRCTWVELPYHPIAPNEWGELELKFDSRGEHGTVGNFVDIATSDERCRIAIWMSAEVNN
jgi:hypothetical protein